MKAMADGIIEFWQCESGAVAAEYGLLIALITLAIIGAVGTFGLTVYQKLYEGVSNKLLF